MNEIHHANVCISEGDCRVFIFDILKSCLNFEVKANPDFLFMENASFGIDDARNLEKWAIGKPLQGGTKASVIVASSITFEAQNALLKVLEEPPLGTYIFFSLPGLGGLLPTFLSRVRILESAGSSILPGKPSFDKGLRFIKSDINGKLSVLKTMSKKEDKAEMLELLKSLESIYYENKAKDMAKDGDAARSLKNILLAKVFASSRGSSPKMLLEWLSCVL